MSSNSEVAPQKGSALEDDGLNEEERLKAARSIQRTYRGHRTRRELKGFHLDPNTRWLEAVKDAQYQKLTEPTPSKDGNVPTNTSARENWRRVGQIARRAGASGSPPPSSSDTSGADIGSGLSGESEKQRERRERAKARNQEKTTPKMMDLQYFLEMVDVKHRYGSNLRAYHNYWKTQPTNQNFFYWLDYGDGKDVEIPERSRHRLDTEQVRYLSKEERMKYLVTVDAEGRLCWAKNGQRITTSDLLYHDSIQGIVEKGDPTPTFKSNTSPTSDSSEDSSDSSEELDSSAEEIEASHYVNEDFERAKGPAKIVHVSPAVVFNHLMRKSMKKGNKWIFVADTSFRLYVGIKQSGSFQHSSFLHGGRISAAGTLKIKDGQLRSLSPLSGHYRPPTANFQAFVHALRDAGVDLSRVSISKSYAVLVGMESYVKTKKKVKNMEKAATHQADVVFRPEKAKEDEEQAKDKSQSAEKERRYLEGQRRQEEQAVQERKKNKGLGARLRKAMGRFKVEDRRDTPPGGPEAGIPPPEGKR
ncbi:MAG: hypothetical protein Q9227_002384 [Pyrenula ochraceoflavens]